MGSYEVARQFGSDLDSKQQSVLSDSLRQLERQNETLVSLAADIRSKVTQVAAAVNTGMNINSLGELQSRGVSFDIACALRQAACENLSRVCHLFDLDTDAVFAAMVGA